MNWKIVFLAFLLLSTVAVTIVVTRPNLEIRTTTFRASLSKVFLDQPVLLQPIDDGPGG